MKVRVSVIVPVGPEAHYADHLDEAIDSVLSQTVYVLPVLVDDMHGLWHLPSGRYRHGYSIVKNAWKLGAHASFNVGVASAETELCFLLGADDTLEPDCIEQCLQAYDREPPETKDRAVYYVGVRYMHGEYEDQYLPCAAMMVSKTVWRHTGGFPPEAAVGAGDNIFHNTCLIRGEAFAKQVCVNEDRPLYNYRVGDKTDTAQHGVYLHPREQVRAIYPTVWEVPHWGAFEKP